MVLEEAWKNGGRLRRVENGMMKMLENKVRVKEEENDGDGDEFKVWPSELLFFLSVLMQVPFYSHRLETLICSGCQPQPRMHLPFQH